MSATTLAKPKTGNALADMAGRSELWMAVAAIGIVVMLVLPLPTPLIDLMLVFNLALSLSVLLVTAYLHSPLEFSVFPSLLLFMALFRLALSISVMRAILSMADAGALVASFGQMVLGGSYVIGFVLFLTLLIVQFIVVTGGTSRVAEVVARFTLDAMPGKQMAIDADLNAGIITEAEARERRRQVSQESDFYGAMDGASKFVKGDSIAAMAVTAINIVAGVIIGVVNLKMDAMTALEVYALLTVGQGLVIQIPGLLMSVASGLIVTRAASEQNLSDDFMVQLKSRPEALSAAAVGCFALGVVPGLPKLPLFLLGGAMWLVARNVGRVRQTAAEQPETDESAAAEGAGADLTSHLTLDTLELELGYGLVPMALKEDGGQLLERITGLRRQLAGELGLLVPPIRVRDNLTLEPNSYVLRLRGVKIATGSILPRFFLAMDGGNVKDPLDGDHVNDPAFGLPAVWVGPDQRFEAERRGYIVVDAASVCITHLGEAVRGRAAELLTRQELAELIEVVKREHPAVIEDLVPTVVTKATLQAVLQNLLDERVPIRDMVGILEALGEAAIHTQSTDDMTEFVRRRLSRVLLDPLCTDGEMPSLVLEPELERRLSEGVVETPFGRELQIPPAVLQPFIDSLTREIEHLASQGHTPVLVCSGRVRLPLRRLLKKFLTRLVLVAYDEVAESAVGLQTLGVVRVETS